MIVLPDLGGGRIKQKQHRISSGKLEKKMFLQQRKTNVVFFLLHCLLYS
jgi:hypothetical protein